jgi:putative colanic acid biosynthesis glycosyltransferase
MSAAPTFSLIVACRNPGPRLRTALDSIWSQRDAAVQLIVIDGASTDGTREWLEQQRPRISSLVSEPDSGIYDAMNKGTVLARGDWIAFLGSDDRLLDALTLSEVAQHVTSADSGVISGEAIFDDGRIYRLSSHANPIARNFVHHQATFYHRQLFGEHGRFDASLTIMADYDFNLRLWKARVPFKAIPTRIAACGSGGASDAGAWRGYREEIAVRHRYFSPLRCVPWDAGSVLRFFRKTAVRSRDRQ